MQVGYYQYDVKYCDKAFNLAKIEEVIQKASMDLLVLPELFTTGILFSDKEQLLTQAEQIPNGYTSESLVRMAEQYNCHIIGSILEVENDNCYNTAIVVGPHGYIGKHRKVHLPDDEKGLFTQGESLDVFEINGVQVGVLVCFECWLPEVSRTLAEKGAQLIVHSANIMSESTFDVVKVRAMENGVYLVCANRIGSESTKEVTYNFRGESRIFDPKGNLLAESGVREDFQVVEIFPAQHKPLQLSDCRDLAQEIRFHRNSQFEMIRSSKGSDIHDV